jgi:hypothetical protein
MKTKAYAQNNKRAEFYARYTRDAQGFYVRNEKPSGGTLNEQRIKDNVRSLVNEAATAGRSSGTAAESEEK